MNPLDPASKAKRPDPTTIAKSAAKCFAGSDGRQMLRYLRTITVERTLGPDVDDAHLRYLEGQRQLVQHISSLIERGRIGPLTHDIILEEQQRKRP